MATATATSNERVSAREFVEIAGSFGCPAELVRGAAVTSPVAKPPHGTVVGNVAADIANWAKECGLGIPSVFSGVLTEVGPDTVRTPDILFVPYDRLPDRKAPDSWYAVPPSLCVEVISDSERWVDVREKTNEYLTFGVDEVWLIEQDLRTLTVVRGDAPMRTLRGDAVVESATMPGFAAKLTDFFWNC